MKYHRGHTLNKLICSSSGFQLAARAYESCMADRDETWIDWESVCNGHAVSGSSATCKLCDSSASVHISVGIVENTTFGGKMNVL